MGERGERGESGRNPVVPLGYENADWVDWRGGADHGPLAVGLPPAHQLAVQVTGTVWRQEPGEVGSGLGKKLGKAGWLLGTWSM